MAVSEEMREEIEAAMEKERVVFDEEWDFGDASAVFLAEKLRGNTIVVELVLRWCEIGAVGARALAEVLAEDNTTLTYLNICTNPLGNDGAEAIALMLTKNETLEDLNLGVCGVGDRGARALGEAMRENSTLYRLVLCVNHFGDDGAQALAEALRGNESLEKLSVGDCQLTNAGASSLFAALRHSNSTLTSLALDGNDSMKNSAIKDSIGKLLDENKAVVCIMAERRACCLLFCCLKLAPTAHEHVVPSIGAVPVLVMRYAVDHAGKLHVAKRFEHDTAVAGVSSAGVRARSASSSSERADDFESATWRRH